MDRHDVDRRPHHRHLRRTRRRQPRRVLRPGGRDRRRRARAAVRRRGGRAVVPRCHRRPRPADGPFLVVDIGGGSTEFVVRHRPTCEATISIDIGCVRLTEQFLEHDPPPPEELVGLPARCSRPTRRRRAASSPTSTRRRRSSAWPAPCRRSPRSSIGLATYDRDRIHHFVLTKAAVEDVFRTLATESLADRIHNPGLERGAGRRDRRRVLRARRRSCAASASTRASCREADILDGLVLSPIAERPGSVHERIAAPHGRRQACRCAVTDRILMGPGPVQPVPRGDRRRSPGRCSATSTPTSSRCSTRPTSGCAPVFRTAQRR